MNVSENAACLVPEELDACPVPEDPDKRREWIKYQLKIRGISIAKLARTHNASRQAVSTALTRSNPRWEHVIAHALGTKPNSLWPERYDPETQIPLPRKALEATT
jgi:Ner family transcriptional regulator